MAMNLAVNEALTPARRRLLAAARQMKREKGYKYLWDRGEKIFLRKEDGTNYVKVKKLLIAVLHHFTFFRSDSTLRMRRTVVEAASCHNSKRKVIVSIPLLSAFRKERLTLVQSFQPKVLPHVRLPTSLKTEGAPSTQLYWTYRSSLYPNMSTVMCRSWMRLPKSRCSIECLARLSVVYLV
ncbi:hypothetical protein J6590_100320 [Homalodisca vitripennis]|nr:hypothetical protein J6590_100320 [Homalodisca vitripennis]